MAMEARGYTGSTETSRMYPLTYKKEDRAGYIVILIYLAVFIIGRISFLFLEVMIYNASETNLS